MCHRRSRTRFLGVCLATGVAVTSASLAFAERLPVRMFTTVDGATLGLPQSALTFELVVDKVEVTAITEDSPGRSGRALPVCAAVAPTERARIIIARPTARVQPSRRTDVDRCANRRYLAMRNGRSLPRMELAHEPSKVCSADEVDRTLVAETGAWLALAKVLIR